MPAAPVALSRYTNTATVHERLERLRAVPRRPGEAAQFWYEPQFGIEAVKVMAGEYAVHTEEVLILTVLGSCIACCLWDRHARIGGMNHYMLPGTGSPGEDSGRYGAWAMNRLIGELLARGASRAGLEARIFGGGRVLAELNSIEVGEQNTRFAIEYLRAENIPLVGQDVLDICPRKVAFLPVTGTVMVKRLASAEPI